MTRKTLFRLWLAVVTVVITAKIALGWGSYGHQQINSAAVQLMDPSSPLAACFRKNATLLTRYAITPDYEWKKVGKAPESEALRAKKASNDHFEHPLHFFEPDAFIKDGKVTAQSAALLPSGEYRKVFPEYQKLRTANEAHVISVDPDKKLRDAKQAEADEVAGHGTAPWRIRQLYRLGVDALKKGDTRMAAYYLGTMGHYVGDMSQPFHGSLNYDGKSHVPTAAGIHSGFETVMLANASESFTGGKADPNTQLWSSFKATEDAVVARGREARQGKGAVTEDSVVREAIGLVASGYPYINPLLDQFANALREHPTASRPSAPGAGKDHSAPSSAAIRAFTASRFTDPITGKEVGPLDVANTRMGDGAALLARVWDSAWEQAKREKPELPDITDCDEMTFDLAFAIENYPRPDYLPPNAYRGFGGGRPHADHEEPPASEGAPAHN